MQLRRHEIAKKNRLSCSVVCLIALVVPVTISTARVPAQTADARTVWDGVYTAEQAQRGDPLYAQYCSACHGTVLEGGEMAPPLAGGPFNANWNGLPLGDLFDRTRVSMPQNNPGSLSRQQYADILAFMLKVGDFPAGAMELSRQTELLKEIRFVSTKP